jgi:hypothetical protein
MKNEFQLNDSLTKGVMIANRKRIDIRDIRREVISQYYRQVISPSLRSHFSDGDFERCSAIYLVGGGVLFSELKEQFEEELTDLERTEWFDASVNPAHVGRYEVTTVAWEFEVESECM